MGEGPGLTPRQQGQQLGVEWSNVTVQNMPSHEHFFWASATPATDLVLNGKVLAKTPVDAGDNFYAPPGGGTLETDLVDGVIQESGGGQPHTNLMPYLCIHFIIALAGVYPPRS
jgi:microcystin-dependent protein